MKAIRIFGRNIHNALKNITRNVSLSAASIICTTITLTISLPLVSSFTLSLASAKACNSSLVAPSSASSLSLTFPLT